MSTPSEGSRFHQLQYVPVPPVRLPWWRRLFPRREPKDRYVRKRSRLEIVLTYTLALVASVLIVWACVGGFLVLGQIEQGNVPEGPVLGFCADEMQQDYQSAADWLSFDATGQTSDQFIQWSQQRDQRLGTVQRCTITGRNYIRSFVDPYEADYSMQATFADGTTSQGTIGVHRYTGENGKPYWAIFHLDPELDLAPSGPAVVTPLP